MERDFVLLVPPNGYDWGGDETANVRVVAGPTNLWDLQRAYLQHRLGWNDGEYIDLEAFEVVHNPREAHYALCEVAGSAALLVPTTVLGNERVKHYLERRRIVSNIEFRLI
jgi:hypothetical protein